MGERGPLAVCVFAAMVAVTCKQERLPDGGVAPALPDAPAVAAPATPDAPLPPPIPDAPPAEPDAPPAAPDAAWVPDAPVVPDIPDASDAAGAVDAAAGVDAGAGDAAPALDGGIDPGADDAAPAGPPDATEPASTEILIDEPRAVGSVDVQPLLDALEKVRPQLETCRPRGAETERVRVQFHVALGSLRLAAPAADNTGDASVARCIANRVRSSRPTWEEGESGILVIEATVPPRPR
jgi:hypothetical protein